MIYHAVFLGTCVNIRNAEEGITDYEWSKGVRAINGYSPSYLELEDVLLSEGFD